MSRYVTIEDARIEIDLDDIDDEDIEEEYERRGLGDGEDIVETEDADLFFIVDQHHVLEWLRQSNPPQEIRDWYYARKGRILL